MKKLLLVLLVMSVVCCLVVVAVAKDADKASTVKGWVSDSKCGAKGAAAGHENCGNKCVGNGEKTVFVTDKDHKVLNVDNADALKDHMGHHVAVKGSVDKDTLHVDSVKMLAMKGEKKSGEMNDMH